MEEKMEQAKSNGTRKLNIFCFKQVCWEDMHPVSPEQLKQLGEVEFEKEGELEGLSRQIFQLNLRKHEAHNKKLLKEGLDKKEKLE